MTDKTKCYLCGDRVEVKVVFLNVNSCTTTRCCRVHALEQVHEWALLPVSQQAGVSVILQVVDERS